MSIKTDLRGHLAANAGVAAITTRISLSRSNESDALPRITVHQIGGDHKHHTLAATGRAFGRFQIDCHADTPIGADTLAEAVRQSLDGFRGTMNAGTFVCKCHLDDERTAYTPPHPGKNESGGVDTIQLDYLFGWNVSVPTFA